MIHRRVAAAMPSPKLSRLELRIMETLWTKGPSSIRELQETFPEDQRPAYTTVQTVVYRLEWKKAVRRARKISNAHVFEAVVSRNSIERRMIDELVGLFGGRALPIVTHLIDSGKLTREEVREAQKALRDLARKDKDQ
jgi:BlaI family transcriptional regulator, penicillinase repressor